MKKVLVVLIGIMLLATSAFALDILSSDSSTASIPVATTTTIYTHSFRTDSGEYGAISYWIYSAAGVADVTIQLEQSWTAPATEGSADGNYTIPVNMADVTTALTTESTWYQQSISVLPLPYGRFKITGIGSNNADTVVKIKVTQMKSLNVR